MSPAGWKLLAGSRATPSSSPRASSLTSATSSSATSSVRAQLLELGTLPAELLSVFLLNRRDSAQMPSLEVVDRGVLQGMLLPHCLDVYTRQSKGECRQSGCQSRMEGRPRCSTKCIHNTKVLQSSAANTMMFVLLKWDILSCPKNWLAQAVVRQGLQSWDCRRYDNTWGGPFFPFMAIQQPPKKCDVWLWAQASNL